MFGFAPIAAAPLGAAGDAGASFDVSFGAAAVVTDGGVVALPVYASSVVELASGDTSVAVAASTFTAIVSFDANGLDATASFAVFAPNVSESASGVDTASAIASFLAFASASGSATDATLVEASNFNAAVADASDIADNPKAFAVMMGGIAEGAEIDDFDSANFLWNIINNAQSTTWTVVKTQN